MAEVNNQHRQTTRTDAKQWQIFLPTITLVSEASPEGVAQCQRNLVAGQHRGSSSWASRRWQSSDRCVECPVDRRSSRCQSLPRWSGLDTACSPARTSPTVARRTTWRPVGRTHQSIDIYAALQWWVVYKVGLTLTTFSSWSWSCELQSCRWYLRVIVFFVFFPTHTVISLG